MKIFDCFPFRGGGPDADMLECRLTEFGNYPVQHILVEAAVDHQGHPKPLYYAENKERFAPWADRIIHVVAGDLPAMAGAAPMDREAAQRDATSQGLADADPGDWLIISDLDEIPNAAAMALVLDQQTGSLAMTLSIFAVDWVIGELPQTPICPVSAVTSFTAARRAYWPVIPGMGHHMTWLGGQAAITRKLGTHCHTQLNGDIAAANTDDSLYRRGVNPLTRFGEFPNPQLTPVDVDETWPRYVYERRCPANWFRPR